jgi:hypothetical protein
MSSFFFEREVFLLSHFLPYREKKKNSHSPHPTVQSVVAEVDVAVVVESPEFALGILALADPDVVGRPVTVGVAARNRRDRVGEAMTRGPRRGRSI